MEQPSNATRVYLEALKDEHGVARSALFVGLGDKTRLPKVREAAQLWREAGHFFAAASAMSEAVHFAWGDGAEVDACWEAALADFEQCVNEERSPLEVYAALQRWLGELHMNYAGYDPSSVRAGARALRVELARRLIVAAHGDAQKQAVHYLGLGFRVRTDLEDIWEADFPDHEVSGGWRTGGMRRLTLPIPPALQLLIESNDFEAAAAVADRLPEGSMTPRCKAGGTPRRHSLRPRAPMSKSSRPPPVRSPKTPTTRSARVNVVDGAE